MASVNQIQAAGIRNVADKLNVDFLKAYENDHIDAEGWSMWCRVFGALNDEVQLLLKQQDNAEE